mgnify:CR=1 FL=1
MKLIKKILAGLLLLFGVPFSMFALIEIANPETSAEERENATAALLILTLPSTVAGGWLAWSVVKQNRREAQERQNQEGDRLREVFFDAVRRERGEITVLEFAMEAQISGQDAKQYLDERAKEYDATFNVGEQGEISYKFPL